MAGAAPVQMFFVLATIGVLHLLAMYAVTDLAAAARLRRAGARWSAWLVPLVGAVVAGAVLGQGAATAPLGVALVVGGWLVLSAAFALRRGRRRP